MVRQKMERTDAGVQPDREQQGHITYVGRSEGGGMGEKKIGGGELARSKIRAKRKRVKSLETVLWERVRRIVVTCQRGTVKVIRCGPGTRGSLNKQPCVGAPKVEPPHSTDRERR